MRSPHFSLLDMYSFIYGCTCTTIDEQTIRALLLFVETSLLLPFTHVQAKIEACTDICCSFKISGL